MSSNISRLAHTWGVRAALLLLHCVAQNTEGRLLFIEAQQLGYNRMQTFSELERLTKRSSNFKEMRAAVDQQQGGCVPYLGIVCCFFDLFKFSCRK